MLTPPRNVKLEIQGKREVFMSWDPPAHLPAESIKDQEYVILWSVDEEERENIFVSHSQNYTFRNLSAGQLLTAAVRFLSKGGKHIGPLSELKQISLPGGWTPSYLIAGFLVCFKISINLLTHLLFLSSLFLHIIFLFFLPSLK